MKIGVLTFSKVNNNGANLQCYALVQTLKNFGHDVRLIDIQIIEPYYGIFHKIIHFPQHLQYILFRHKFLSCFTRSYHNIEDLKNNFPEYDLYIVGSDQVWNPEITKSIDPLVYFFSFLPEDKRRISYAASFGLPEWSWEQLTPKVKELLEKFERISVREEQGQKICKETFGVDAQVVCDPTFLLSSYDNICGEYVPEKRCNELVYFKFSRNAFIESFLLNQAKKKGLKMVKLGDFHPRIDCVFRPVYSVRTWLNNIRYAQFVCTDSFHCMVFCILFNTPFIAMPSLVSRSSRMLSLLQNLGLMDRFCWDEKELTERFENIYNTPIDFGVLKGHIAAIRQKGLEFLQSIEGV